MQPLILLRHLQVICLCFYLFHEILLFCGWSFPWRALIMFLTLFMRYYCSVVGVFLWRASILFLTLFMRYYCSVVGVFLWSALILFLAFSWDSIILSSMFTLKYFDTVFGFLLEILLFCGRHFPCRALIMFFGLFHVILLFCGRPFLWSALIIWYFSCSRRDSSHQWSVSAYGPGLWSVCLRVWRQNISGPPHADRHYFR